MAESDRSFLMAFITNMVITLIMCLIFIILRKRMKKIYEPRTLNEDINSPPKNDNYIGWIKSTIMFSDEKLLKSCGGDSLIYVRFLRICLFIILLQAIFGILILGPVNFSGKNKNLPDDNPKKTVGLEIISMSNIPNASNLLWFHTIGIFVNTIITLRFLITESANYIDFNNNQMRSTKKIENYTTMVSEIPKGENYDDDGLRELFQQMYPSWNGL